MDRLYPIELAIDFELTEGIPIPYQVKLNVPKSAAKYLIPGDEGALEDSPLSALERGRTFSNMVSSYERMCGVQHEGDPIHTRSLTSIGHRAVRGLSARPTFASDTTATGN